MPRKTYQSWTLENIEFLKSNHQKMNFPEIAKHLKRTIKSVRHKYNELGLEKRRAKIGDVVKGWLIVDIYQKHNGQQYVSWAKIRSTKEITRPEGGPEREVRLQMKLTEY